ncbi:coiled-coil domain-containing protein 86 isoform X1 [Gouania willdenowi]|uniref:Coiled-coil domain-containing protein 86 n=1 Tax=Gouania willdenowi TaxID=441366 RepID=A0A8C5D1A0_GOUWI|nr:coiled-coil domain-containing protein 86 isoform X1 [Gouania willdenowi]
MSKRRKTITEETSVHEEGPEEEQDPPETRRTRSGRRIRTPAPELPTRTPSRRTRRSVIQEQPEVGETHTEEAEREDQEMKEETQTITSSEPQTQDPPSESENQATPLDLENQDPSSESQTQDPSSDLEIQDPPSDPQTQALPLDLEIQDPSSEPQSQDPPSEPQTQAAPSDLENQAPPSEPQTQAAPSDLENQAPPSEPQAQTPSSEVQTQVSSGDNGGHQSGPPPSESTPASSEVIPNKKPRLALSGKQTMTIPLGKPKSGRVWKDRNKQRFSAMLRDKPLCSSWEKKMEARREKELVKQYSLQLKEEKAKQKEDKRKRREEHLKRRAENERKAEIVQVIRNTAKIKRMKKKQLRKIEKRDTLALLQKSQKQKIQARKKTNQE